MITQSEWNLLGLRSEQHELFVIDVRKIESIIVAAHDVYAVYPAEFDESIHLGHFDLECMAQLAAVTLRMLIQ